MHIAAAGHVTEVTGPVQALRNYLRRNYARVSFATHPFGYCNIETSVFEHSRGNDIVKTHTARAARGLSVARDIIANLLWFTFNERSDIFIGIDNVNAFCGLILRMLGRTKKCVYYVIDYTPQRFNGRLLNLLYHALDRFVVTRCDEVWNISARIAAVRETQGVPPSRNRIVGVGVDLHHVVQPQTRNRHDLVCVSHLTQSKGIQLAINAMPSIRAAIPNARLLIIGTGPYESTLRALVKDQALEDSVCFLGLMDHSRLFSLLPTCGVALAPYVDDPNSITYYADPTKPKEYLACGLPVIITNVPWIAQEIAEKPMGVCIHYNVDQLTRAAIHLMDDDAFYDMCVANAKEFTRELSWSSIYSRALPLSA